MSSPGALSNIRVLDLSRVLAGPWASQILGDLGADILKVERPGAGDDTRLWGPPFLKDPQGQPTGESAYYLCTNRNKRSLAIDMALPAGQALIRALALQCDVVIENFKVGGLKAYGLDADSLRALNSRLIYCSITGYGQQGPLSHKAGYDFAIQAEAGLMSVTGEKGGEPQKVGVAVTDLMTGVYATTAILAALHERHTTGKGRHIDASLFDVQVAMLANQASNELVGHTHPTRMGNAHPNIVPYQVFPTRDGHMVLAVGNDGQFERFCVAAGHAELRRDPAELVADNSRILATLPWRPQHADLDGIVRDALKRGKRHHRIADPHARGRTAAILEAQKPHDPVSSGRILPATLPPRVGASKPGGRAIPRRSGSAAAAAGCAPARPGCSATRSPCGRSFARCRPAAPG